MRVNNPWAFTRSISLLSLVFVDACLAAKLLPRQKPTTPPSAASFYVPSLPGLTVDSKRQLHVYAGHLLSDATAKSDDPTAVNAHLYFVLTKARRTADRERLIIWFNGGPGCSSFDGLMMETGPWRMDGKDKLKLIDGGWEEYANVLYLDQPVGTGFSYGSTNQYVHELDEAASQVVEFLKNWYEVFPEFKDMDTYLAGESFAGQFIPYTADAILKTTQVSTPLKGLAIGNGWIDPRAQYPAYIDFAVQEKLLKKDTKEYTSAMKIMDRCNDVMNKTKTLNSPHIGDCEIVMGAAIEHLQSTVNGQRMCMNVYDIRLSDVYPACGLSWPPDLTYIKPYLQREEVKMALHATAKQEAWVECRSRVGQELSMKKSPPSVELLPSLLEKLPVMLFHGDQDFICNTLGAERLIEGLEWNGAKGFSTKPEAWKFNGTDAGEWTTDRNLTYVKVFGASHMVGFDVPNVAHDMMLRFMGVDFTAITGGSAMIPSGVGKSVKILPGSTSESEPGQKTGTEDGKNPTKGSDNDVKLPGTPPKDEAMWQAYYNAGSAALVFLLIAIAVGVFVYFYMRSRRKRASGGVALGKDEEEVESLPLTQSVGGYGRVDGEDEHARYRDHGKGKGKAKEADLSPSPSREAIFDVGDSDDEDDRDRRR